ncbi:MAG: GDP-mannose 4,6-dehydratase [Sedimentisphaerales bacterium]|nr:GDP-mannose 4,6-dehydratase [Sedimentisphaerales bacterium]
MKTAMITGITSQDGAYLSKLLIEKNYRIIGLVRSSSDSNLKGLDYLGIKSKVEVEECNLLDITNVMMVLEKYRPNEIYNLAAQSSVGISFSQPVGTIEFNTMSVLYLLEGLKRFDKKVRFYQASSSEVFGKVKNLPVTEETPIHPLSPYAISKAAAHWITVNYREAFGLYACCGILFNHESFLRRKGFFVKKVIKEALEIKQGKREFLKVGNTDVRRDFGYGPEYVKAMWLMLQADKPDDYIICSGKSLSLKTIIQYVFNRLGISEKALVIDSNLYRPTDMVDIYGDSTKAKKELGWKYEMDFFDVLDELITQEESQKL